MINTLPPASLIMAPEASVGAAELHHRLPSVRMLERGTRRCCVSDASSQLQTTDKCHINTHKGKFDLLLVHIYIEKGCVWCEGKSTPGLSPGKCNSNTLSPRGFFSISFHSINKRPILVWSNYSIKTAWIRALIHLWIIAKVIIWQKN